MIEQADHARRLANAIATDITLYNEERIDSGIHAGTLDVAMRDAVDEGLMLFNSRVAPSLRARSRFFDAAIVRILRARMTGIARRAWATGIEELRAAFAHYPNCVVCRAPLGPERVAFQGLVDGHWLLLLGCSCLAVTGLGTPDGELFAAPHLEASAAVVARLRERLVRAREAGDLEAAVDAIEGDPPLSRLLGVPEVSKDAEPAAGILRLAADASILDPPNAEASPWPCLVRCLVAIADYAVTPSVQLGHAFPAVSQLEYLGRVPGGWRVARPRLAGIASYWGLSVERRIVTLEPA